jgi:hypothetical protein
MKSSKLVPLPHSLVAISSALALVSTIAFLSPIAGTTGCTKQEGTQVQNALTPLESCEVNTLLGGALEDPAQLVTACIGTAISALITIANELITDALGEGDAGATTADAAVAKGRVTRISVERLQHLQRVVANLKAYVADGGK